MKINFNFPLNNAPALQRPGILLEETLSRLGIDLSLAARVDPALAEDAFRLSGKGAAVDLAGGSARGVAFGLYELRRLLTAGAWPLDRDYSVAREPAFALRGVDLYDNPGEKPFDTRFRNPEIVLEYGFNTQIIHSLAALCLYEDSFPQLYPGGSQGREWVVAKRAEVQGKIREAKCHDLKVILSGDLLVFPKTALEIAEAVHEMPGGEPFAHRKGRGFCPASPLVGRLIEATFDEIFALFPEVDGVMVRTGECYTQSESVLAGNTPLAGTCARCAGMDHAAKLALTIETAARTICDKHNRTYIQRAWSYWPEWHSQSAEYLKVLGGVRARPNLIFSFKQTRTDYWRYNELNPNFGVGEQPQCAEFQCQREYECKQAFPNYMGRYYAEGGEEVAAHGGVAEIARRGVRAAWCWARGGGWGGPYLAREDWAAVNVYALGRLLWTPEADPFDLVRDWARLEYALPPDSPVPELLVTVMRKSEQAMLRARYVRDFSLDNKSAGWEPSLNWFRDDVFSGRLRAMHTALLAKGKEGDAIREKAEAHEIYLSLREDFNAVLAATAAVEPWTSLKNSIDYGEAWMATTRHYFAAIFEYLSWDAGGRVEEVRKTRALQALNSWNEAWQRLAAAARLTGAPSAMTDKGMLALIEEAKKALS